MATRMADITGGYDASFRADYQCMKCGHKVYGKHPVTLSRCMGCGKNSWRRYVKPEEGAPTPRRKAAAPRPRRAPIVTR